MSGISLTELGTALTQGLVSAGFNAVDAWSTTARPVYAEPVICVGVKTLASSSPGLGEYLGIRDGAEVTGKRLEICFALDLYSPLDEVYGARACAELLDRLIAALPEAVSGSFRMTELRCADTAFDEDSGMFLCRCELSCRSYACAELTAEGEFRDFRLTAALV